MKDHLESTSSNPETDGIIATLEKKQLGYDLFLAATIDLKEMIDQEYLERIEVIIEDRYKVIKMINETDIRFKEYVNRYFKNNLVIPKSVQIEINAFRKKFDSAIKKIARLNGQCEAKMSSLVQSRGIQISNEYGIRQSLKTYRKMNTSPRFLDITT
jgi:hypothetical protein